MREEVGSETVVKAALLARWWWDQIEDMTTSSVNVPAEAPLPAVAFTIDLSDNVRTCSAPWDLQFCIAVWSALKLALRVPQRLVCRRRASATCSLLAGFRRQEAIATARLMTVCNRWAKLLTPVKTGLLNRFP